MPKQKIIHLPPPLLSESYIKEKISCIRAHRERIFNTSVERVDTKLICHNYGHGGAGWTFLFGCVKESIKNFEQTLEQNPSFKNKSITIIGAGCYGLLTALSLADKGHTVQIIAQEFDDIASNKAAGFFFPRPRKVANEQERALFESLGMESYATYLSIAQGAHRYLTQGASIIPAYYGLDIDPGFAPYISAGLIMPPENVTLSFAQNKQYAAMAYNAIFINAPKLMHELKQQINKRNIPTQQGYIDNFNDCDDSIIFNCAGLGAKKLTDDNRLIPIQGHLITLKNQPNQLNCMLNFKVIMHDQARPRDELIYYAPKDNGILGITFIRGQANPDANVHEFDRLLQRCNAFFGL